ncbi:hypothetical protein PCL_11261 [Purpureocillium lilacinum]|uniref:F-box domain-containing protein n=1 Tax=Purpureocillium lilacinum TaxID=33203 RepID=A0A2U3DQ24_PURLI|nr:hypothetical protein PCL_11261 [Purpureocillium lilacinum]
MSNLLSLPIEIIAYISERLDCAAVCNFRLASRNLRAISSSRFTSFFGTVAIMLSRNSLRSLESLSHDVLGGHINELVICTTHVITPVYDNILNKGPSLSQFGRNMEESDDRIPSTSFVEVEAEKSLVDALCRLPNCRRICVTDSGEEKPLGLSQLQKLVRPSEPQTSISYAKNCHDYDPAGNDPDDERTPEEDNLEPRRPESERFVYAAVTLAIAAISQCSNVTSIGIEVGWFISSPAIEPIALVLPMQAPNAPLNFQQVRCLTLEVDPRPIGQVCYLEDFFRQFSRIQDLELSFWPPDNTGMLNGLAGLESKDLRSLKINRCRQNCTKGLTDMLRRHRSNFRELSLIDVELQAKEDWANFLDELNKGLSFCTVQLSLCMHWFSDGWLPNSTFSVGTLAGISGLREFVDVL